MNTTSVSSPNNAGCITAFVSGFSRLLLLIFWISDTARWDAIFGTVIWPCLGFLFLPFTTLIFAWLMQPTLATPNPTIEGADWLWLILAVVIDVANWSTAGYANRNRVPGYGTDTVTPPPSAPTGSAQ
ncbi:MAG: hypothetical protein U0452_01035 [Anaerolineae bacterium]